MNAPAVSIIIPVYKAQESLPKCLDSILAQTFPDWELILVDDGSPDRSGEICDDYAKSDSRICVIHQANGGVSRARNQGIAFAKGEFISFVDADDSLKQDYLEKLSADRKADLTVCGFTNWGKEFFVPQARNFELRKNPEYIAELVEVPFYLDSPWAKIFRRSLLQQNALAFDTGLRLGEDTLFAYEYLSVCSKISVIPDALYDYAGVWGGSESKYKLSYQEIEYASKRLIDALKKINEDFSVKIDTRYKCFYLSKLQGLFDRYKDRDIYDLYVKTHDVMPFAEFLGSSRISPLPLAMLRADKLAADGAIAENKDFLQQVKSFMTCKVSDIAFDSPKHKLFYRLLQYFGSGFTAYLLYARCRIFARSLQKNKK